jgi:hypothetical protein
MADPMSDAFVRPEASLFIRQVLQAALQTAAGSKPPPAWEPEAKALLANVLMNDVLNWWNKAGPNELNDASNAADEAVNANLALGYHARGLVRRARRNPQGASEDFETALTLDSSFARAHAQAGNQKALRGQPRDSHEDFANARRLAPHDPVVSYFDWGEGRAYFEEGKWVLAIYFLERSVKELTTVWYNRCYLAAAQNSNGDQAEAQKTIDELINNFDKDDTFDRIRQLDADDPNHPGRKRVLDFVIPRLP